MATSAVPEPNSCGTNEVWNDCGNECAERYCCSTDNDPKGHCKNSICPEVCEPRCECGQGFARDRRTGQCILKEECVNPPVCPENEELVCTTCSEPKCATQYTSKPEVTCWGADDVKPISPWKDPVFDSPTNEGCTSSDLEACYCISGYKRMYNSNDPQDRGVCVPADDCPVVGDAYCNTGYSGSIGKVESLSRFFIENGIDHYEGNMPLKYMPKNILYIIYIYCRKNLKRRYIIYR